MINWSFLKVLNISQTIHQPHDEFLCRPQLTSGFKRFSRPGAQRLPGKQGPYHFLMHCSSGLMQYLLQSRYLPNKLECLQEPLVGG